MELKIYQVDAFANKVFEGNPAAIVPLARWLPDDLMQAIASENNLSETAFFVPKNHGYHIRWFTPTVEIDLCGHATLASAYVIFNILKILKAEIEFESRSGILTVSRKNEWLELNFPSQAPSKCEPPKDLLDAFYDKPIDCLKAEDYMLVLADEGSVVNANPDMNLLTKLDLRGVIISAKSSNYDFVTRFFGPKCGVDEDPVTGSAFTQLVPYWAKKLDKDVLSARQVSKRGGEVNCIYAGQRVKIAGKAVLYMTGTIDVKA